MGGKKEVDIVKVLELLECGNKQADMSQELGISIPTLQNRIADVQTKTGLLLQYRAIQSLQLTELQARVLEAITPEKINDAPLKDLIYSYKILKDKERVMEGLPSDVKGLVGYLIEIEKEQIAAGDTVEVSNFDVSPENENEEDLPNL